MITRVNVETEAEPLSILVDTEDIDGESVRKAVEHAARGGRERESFGPRLEVVHGQIIQEGYEVNEALREAHVAEEGIPVAYVQTTV